MNKTFGELATIGQSLILRQHIAVTWLIPFLASCFAIALSMTWWRVSYLSGHGIAINPHYLLYMLRDFHPWYLVFSTLPYLLIVNTLPWTKSTSAWRLIMYSVLALFVELACFTFDLCHQYKLHLLSLGYWFDMMYSVVFLPVIPAMMVRLILLSAIKTRRNFNVHQEVCP